MESKFEVGEQAYVFSTGRKVVVMATTQYPTGIYFGTVDAELSAQHMKSLKAGDLNWLRQNKLGTEAEYADYKENKRLEEIEKIRHKKQVEENSLAKKEKREPRIVLMKQDGTTGFDEIAEEEVPEGSGE